MDRKKQGVGEEKKEIGETKRKEDLEKERWRGKERKMNRERVSNGE
jgi:hypothetical protein